MPTISYTLDDGFGTPGKKLKLKWQPATIRTHDGALVVGGPPKEVFSTVGTLTTIEGIASGMWAISNFGVAGGHRTAYIDVDEDGGDVTAQIAAAIAMPQNAPVTDVIAAARAAAEAAVVDLEVPPEVVAGAVAADLATRDLVESTDPRIARNYGVESAVSYVDITLDLSDRFVGGTRADGTHEVAGLMISGDPSTTTNIDTEGISFTPYVDKSGRLPEGHLDLAGQIPQYTLDAWSQRMTGGTGQPIWLIHSMGQSNAVRSDSLPVSVADSDPRILQWDGSQWITHPVAATQFEYLAYFLARHLIRSGMVPQGTRIGIIQHAVGSTGFSSTDEVSPPAGRNYSAGGTWDRNYGGSTINLYTLFRTRALAALAASPAGSAHYLAIWSQGEQDRSYRTQSTYAANLDDLIGQARTDLGVADLPFLIGSMTASTIAANTGDTVGIDRAHEDTPRRLVRTAFIRGPHGMDKHDETIHYSSQAQMARAPLFARAIDTARLNVAAAKPLPPQNLRVTRSGSTATITWEHPDSRVTAFTIETATDGTGSTWSPVTLPIAIAHTATVTVDPASPLWVRGSSTNEIGTSYTTEVRA
ncbi:tail protein [Gordonia phage Denise]|uniref:Minor tail protein n=1 Tax=Gordonia phage Denise TaxID=2652879 RepID=A0A5P8DER8_9CAUD|nr:tail protein [Gordonia phage Denise]QFP96640.1 minor tail protein [Gordonia phage Denise]